MDAHEPRAVLWGIGILVVLLYALIPVAWITSISLKTPEQVADRKFFSGIYFENYEVIFKDDMFISALINSLGIAAIATLISIVLAAMAAYATSRLDFTGQDRDPLRRAGRGDVPADLDRRLAVRHVARRSGSTTPGSA